MSLITAENLGLSFGARDVFSGLSIDLPNDARVGLVGPNGIGKTSLLRMLANVAPATHGKVWRDKNVRIGYLRQEAVEAFAGREHSVYEEALTAFDTVRDLERQLRSMEAQMTTGDMHDDLLTDYGHVQEAFEHGGGYDYDVRVAQVLDGLGFTADQWTIPLSHLSGGQKTRALLARLLLEQPTLLILDEPTNHLDVMAVEWLESTLKSWQGALLITSHDRYFLDRVVDRIWEMTPNHVESYRGNYSAYVMQRQDRWERNQLLFDTEMERLQRELELIRRYIAWRKFDEAKGKLKRLSRDLVAIERFGVLGALEKKGVDAVHIMSVEDAHQRMKAIKNPLVKPPVLRMKIKMSGRGGVTILRIDHLQVGHAGKPLYTVDHVELPRLARVALIGPNGSGKTTFLRTVLGDLPPISGSVELGAGLKIGYFAQAHDTLHPEQSVIDEVMAHSEMSQGDARTYLAQYLFRGDDVWKKVSALSGGERGRLALAILALDGVNVLLLDEPTNHLDITAQEVLQDVLEAFDGTLLMVSHDRYLVDRLATIIWELRDGRLHVFDGPYQEYLVFREKELLHESIKVEAAKKPRVKQIKPVATDKRQTKAGPGVAELEKNIATTESLIAEATTALHAASELSNMDEVTRLGFTCVDLQQQLEELLSEWSALST